MPKIIIQAHACEFTYSPALGVTCRQHSPMDTPLARILTEVRTVADIEAAQARMRDELVASYGKSFFVYAILPRGERAPNGYRKARLLIEHDHTLALPLVASVAEETRCNDPGAPRIGHGSPWGIIDNVTHYGPDAVSVDTPSHGGFWVAPGAMWRIPEPLRATRYSPGSWFEEDSDWVIPYLWLGLHRYQPDGDDHRAVAVQSLCHWHDGAALALALGILPPWPALAAEDFAQVSEEEAGACFELTAAALAYCEGQRA